MTYHDMNNLRLEIEVPTTGLPNLVQNPTGEKGSWGWITPVANSRITTSATPGLTFNTTVSQAAYFTTEFMPVAPSKYVSTRLDLTAITASHNIKARYEWYNAAKTLLSSSTQSGALSALQTHYTTTVQAPANTAYVKLRIDLYNGVANPAANASVTFNKAMVTWADTGTVSTTRTNLITNPSFEVDTAGWTGSGAVGISRQTTVARSGTYSLRINNTDNLTNLRVGTVVNGIVGGADYALMGSLHRIAKMGATQLQIWWYTGSNKTGTLISNNKIEATGAVGWNDVSAVFTAPSNAVSASIEAYFGVTGGTALTNTEYAYIDKLMLEKASTVGTYIEGTVNTGPSAFPYSEPVTWQNILGPTSSIKITRKGLDVGLMSVDIRDALLDPSVSDVIRPGKKIRARAWYDGTQWPYEDVNEFRSLFEGVVSSANVTYSKDKVVGSTVETRITLAASDAVAALANQGESRGVANLIDIAYIMEGKGVPWDVVGVGGNQVTSATVVSFNENASVLDQIAITRDTNHGYAFVSSNGVLTVLPAASIYDNFVGFSDDPADMGAGTKWHGYTDIDVSFSTEDCINEVKVNWLRYNVGTGTTTEETYGPYRDEVSIAQWGPRSATFTIHGTTESEANIAAFAADVLAANATPSVKVNSLGFKVKDAKTMNAATSLDLMYNTGIRWQGVEYEPRTSSIEHTITPTDWTVALTFAEQESVAAPTWVPSPPFNGLSGLKAAVLQTGTTSIPDSTTTTLTWNSNLLTSTAVSAGTSGITINRAGLYRVSGQVSLVTPTQTGLLQVAVRVNGVNVRVLTRQPVSSSSPTVAGGSSVLSLAVGDIVTFGVFHTTGAARTLYGGDLYATTLEVEAYT